MNNADVTIVIRRPIAGYKPGDKLVLQSQEHPVVIINKKAAVMKYIESASWTFVKREVSYND